MTESRSAFTIVGGFMKMGVLGIIAIVLIVMIFIKSGGEKLLKTWSQQRTNPFAMPFAGAAGKNPSQNAKAVMYTNFKKNHSSLMKPIQYIVDLIKKVIGKLVSSLNIFRALMKPIRTFISNAAETFFTRLSGIMSAIIYFFLKIRDLLRRLASSFRLSLYLLQAMQFTLKSTWDGPVGQVSREWGYAFGTISSFFCLHPDTRLRLANGQIHRVADLKLGDYLASPDGSTQLLGMARCHEEHPIVYRVGDALLTGEHLVYVHQGGRRICRRADSIGERMTLSEPVTFYCPLTENHTFYTERGVILADFEETTCPKTETALLRHSLQCLNSESSSLVSVSEASPAMMSDSLITLENGHRLPICQLRMGDQLQSAASGENRVLGILETLPMESNIYELRSGVAGSSRQIAYLCGEWTTFSSSKNHRIRKSLSHERLYSIMTTQGVFRCEDVWLADISDGLATRDIATMEDMIQTHMSEGCDPPRRLCVA